MGKGNPQKNKGKGVERETCEIFKTVFGGSWQRTFTSGAWTGGKNQFRTNTLSQSQILNNTNDIVPPDELKNAAIEVKSRKEFNFHHMFRKEGILELNEWIKQVNNSGIDMIKSFPMIVFKPNRQGFFIVLWKEKLEGINYQSMSYTNYYVDDKEYIITELESFLNKFKNELEKKFA